MFVFIIRIDFSPAKIHKPDRPSDSKCKKIKPGLLYRQDKSIIQSTPISTYFFSKPCINKKRGCIKKPRRLLAHPLLSYKVRESDNKIIYRYYLEF